MSEAAATRRAWAKLNDRPGPVATVVVALAITVAVTGVLVLTNLGLDEAALGLGYELILVAIPGLALSLALDSRYPSALRHLALAWPFGIAIELLCFAITAGLDLRFLAGVGQVGVAVALFSIAEVRIRLVQLLGRVRVGVGEIPSGGLGLMVTLALGLLVVLVLQYYFPSPLPSSVEAVQYYVDIPFHIALGAEAANHWPMTDPNLAGEPLPYHIFSYMHTAAVHEVTGLGVDAILLRTFPIAPLLATVLVLLALGREITGRLLTGAVAVLLLFFVGELDLDYVIPSTYFHRFLFNLWLSPTLLFGLPFCGAILLLLVREGGIAGWRSYVGLGILVAAATGAKGSIVPVVLGGLILHVIWCRVATGRWAMDSLRALAIAVPTFAAFYVLIYSGASGGVSLAFSDFLQYTLLVPPDGTPLSFAQKLAFTPVAVAFTWLALVGILPLILSRRLDNRDRLLISVLISGLLLFVGLSQAGGSQLYFAYPGLLAGVAVSAKGIVDLGARLGSNSVGPVVAASLLSLVLGVGLLVYTYWNPAETRDLNLIVAGLVGAVAATLAIWAIAGRVSARGWTIPAGILVAILLSLGLLDPPGDLAKAARGKIKGESPYVMAVPPNTRGINSNVLVALHWLRDNTDVDDVVAVNNQRLTPRSESSDARFFSYAAFGERRTFLGGWSYSQEGQAADIGPLRERVRANRVLLGAKSCSALRLALRDAPVQYVLYDHFNGTREEPLGEFLAPIYENADASIFEVADADCSA